MLERKEITLLKDENSTLKINTMYNFGWVLEHANLNKMIFKRDDAMPRYKELYNLYDDYCKQYALMHKKISKAFFKILYAFTLIALAVSIIRFFIDNSTKAFIVFFIFVGLTVISYILWIVLSKRRIKKCKEKINEDIEQAKAIIITDEVNEFMNKINYNYKEETFSGADEILKYKKLMDEGIITKEEFEKKKQELLK